MHPVPVHPAGAKVWAGQPPERKSGAVRSAPPRPIENLDIELPGYAWDLLPPLDNYRAHNWQCFQYFEQSHDPAFLDVRRPYVSLYTSLNCPHNCDYCCIHTIFGKPGIKNWSMDTVAGWIDDLVQKHGVRNFRFADELFMLNRARVTRFCELLEERGYDLNIWVYARIDTIFDDLLPRLKKVGVNWICPGIESGNAEVRADVNKNIRRDVVSTIRAIQDAGIHIIGNYMFGLPHDTLETMQQTLDLALELANLIAKDGVAVPIQAVRRPMSPPLRPARRSWRATVSRSDCIDTGLTR